MGHPLFSAFQLRSLTFANRIGVSPMCQYSSEDGFATDWHLVHLGARAQGGAGLVTLEAAAVTPEGRISPGDLGIWKDEHIPALKRIAEFLHSQGARAGMQLAHAGRKASMTSPFLLPAGTTDRLVLPAEGGWQPVAPSAIAFSPSYAVPTALDQAGIDAIIEAFRQAARRVLAAGFDFIELHAAHGYLLHEFLSPLVNHRTDAYGGDLQGRMKFPLEVIETVRAVWPAHKPLFLRVSSSDYVDGGVTIEDTVAFAKAAKALGVDVVDCSSGGNTPVPPKLYPGYQVPYAEAVRKGAGVATMAIGLILDAELAETIIASGKADLIALARPALEDPNFAIHASAALTGTPDYGLAPTPAKSGLDRLAQALKHMAKA